MEARILEWREVARKQEEKKRKTETINSFMKCVPARFRDKTFSDYCIDHEKQIRVKTISEKFVSTFRARLEKSTNLHFLGSPGTGKTFLSLIMCQELVKLGFTAEYQSSLQFLRELLEKKYASEASYQSMLDHFKRIQFLVLDEISESVTKDGAPSEIERKILFDVVNARYGVGQLCTVIISNRDKAELVNRLGAPIMDRLLENSATLIFDWNSYRQK